MNGDVRTPSDSHVYEFPSSCSVVDSIPVVLLIVNILQIEFTLTAYTNERNLNEAMRAKRATAVRLVGPVRQVSEVWVSGIFGMFSGLRALEFFPPHDHRGMYMNEVRLVEEIDAVSTAIRCLDIVSILDRKLSESKILNSVKDHLSIFDGESSFVLSFELRNDLVDIHFSSIRR